MEPQLLTRRSAHKRGCRAGRRVQEARRAAAQQASSSNTASKEDITENFVEAWVERYIDAKEVRNNDSDDDDDECVACKDCPATMDIFACGHVSLCASCSAQVARCPLCRCDKSKHVALTCQHCKKRFKTPLALASHILAPLSGCRASLMLPPQKTFLFSCPCGRRHPSFFTALCHHYVCPLSSPADMACETHRAHGVHMDDLHPMWDARYHAHFVLERSEKDYGYGTIPAQIRYLS